MCAISGEATQEAALEGMLRKVQDKWTGVELPVKQYKEAKDAYILGSVEDVQTVLEDSLAMMATICSSRFVAGAAQCPCLMSPLNQDGAAVPLWCLTCSLIAKQKASAVAVMLHAMSACHKLSMVLWA